MEHPQGPPNDDDRPDEVFRRHARLLNARWWRWPLLEPSYHLFADALVWADELPFRWRRLGIDHVLRPLWHYRMGLILGETRRFVELWELGKRLFPHWIGFHPSRCRPVRR